MRLQYPTNIRMIKLPCTGKLEVIHLLKALEAARTVCTPRLHGGRVPLPER